MAPHRIVRASIVVLLVLGAALPAASASSGPTASILAPVEDERVVANAPVVIHYAGYTPGARNVSGYLMLDGVSAGTFTTKTSGGPRTNGTTFEARLHPEGIPSGTHLLVARVFTELDDPVDTPPVSVFLDLPPVIAGFEYSYDRDTLVLSASADVTDDGGWSVVKLVAGANNTTGFANGPIALSLPAPRAPGTYAASFTARDGLGQVSAIAFTFEVEDRPAIFTDLSAVYELGGTVRVRAQVADPDGLANVTATASNGTMRAGLVNGTWEAIVNVTQQLGTFNATMTARDPLGGVTTSAPVAFTIGGPRATVFERSMTTQAGAYADEITFVVPPMVDGWIELCVDACAPLDDVLLDGTARGLVDDRYRASCGGAAWNTPACGAITGRPGSGTQIKPCEPHPNSNPTFELLRGVVRPAHDALDGAVGIGPCTSAIAIVNATLDEHPVAGPAVHQAHATEGAEVVVTLTRLGNAATAQDRVTACSSTGFTHNEDPNGTAAQSNADHACGFATIGGAAGTVTWAQGPTKTMTVRVSGVRV